MQTSIPAHPNNTPTINKRSRIGRLSLALSATTAVIASSGCVAKTDLANEINVNITNTTCTVSTTESKAGTVSFKLENKGSDVNEFEILAADKLRVVGEKENITPGQKVSFVTNLEPGDYFTACKFQQVGAPIGLSPFTVTGSASTVTESKQAMIDTAVTQYIAYLKSQSAELLPLVNKLTAAYRAGDDQTARKLFATARVPYERIEPTAESFGDLDPKIDFREVDAVADNLIWTGFHRIEKDLWPPAVGALNSDGKDAHQGWQPSTPAERATLADDLITDVAKLHNLVNETSFKVSISAISNGAISLLDEVAAGKITGEEDWWSGTDLSDFAANVQGAGVAFGATRAIAEQNASGKELATQIDSQFKQLNAELAKYGSIESGFVNYQTVTNAQRKVLSDRVNALAEPLSKLTKSILE